MGDALLLQGQRVTPEAAGRAGFEFMTPTLDEALRWEMGLLL
jgi:NAD dependent epimerase/dehydratase family enzyme